MDHHAPVLSQGHVEGLAIANLGGPAGRAWEWPLILRLSGYPAGPAHMERSADWLDQAQGDLAHARHVAEAGFFDWACFSAQQAAEKAVKAALQRHGADVWGHSVVDLLNALAEVADVPPHLLDQALELDKAYIPTRYPDAHPSGSPRRRYTRSEAERLVPYAANILSFCAGIVSGTQPG
jgi:HEPN domain-containing protein